MITLDGDQTLDKRKITWDGTITAGNVLTTIGMVVALLVWGLRLENRVDLLQERVMRSERIQENTIAQTAAIRDQLAAVRADVGTMRADQISTLRAVQRIENYVDRVTPGMPVR